MKKNGFTLIEVIVSVVLVSVVMVSLLGSLIQLRQTYTVIHENSDVIVYSSSISRVINNDLALNNGIRYCSCAADGQSCDIILGNNQKRQLKIFKKCFVDGRSADCNTPYDNKEKIIRTTLKYTNNTLDGDNKLVYIRTLELKKFEKDGIITAKGYNFADMSTTVYEYDKDSERSKVDQFYTILVRLNNEINEDISKYDITLYTAGRYDYSNLLGKTYTLELNSNGATLAGTTRIDEVFGVGYFMTEENHNVSNRISLNHTIQVPENESKAFLGYFYRPAGSEQKIQVIDSRGMVVTSSRFFREEVDLNLENDANKSVIMAEWGECNGGYHIVSGKCVPRQYNVTLDRNGGTGGPASYTATYLSTVPDISSIPYKAGYKFSGYYNDPKQYNDDKGKGKYIYDIADDSTAIAKYSECANKAHAATWVQNNDCEISTCNTGYTKKGSGSNTYCEGNKYTATLNKNGVTSISTNSQCSATACTCQVSNDSGNCSITLPGVTRSGFTHDGWATTSTATSGNTTVTLTSNVDLYAITHKKVTVSFYKNGNGGSDTTKDCTIRNTATSCSITSPDITVPSGFTKIGWSTGTSRHQNDLSVNTAKSVSADAKYYAQTTKASKTYTLTFSKGTGVYSIWDSKKTCSIDAVYNGASQASSCDVQLPYISPNNGYAGCTYTGGYVSYATYPLSSTKTIAASCVSHGNGDHVWNAMGYKVFSTDGWCLNNNCSANPTIYKAKSGYCSVCGMSVDYYKFNLGYSGASISSRFEEGCTGGERSGWIIFDDRSLSSWTDVHNHSSGVFPRLTPGTVYCP